MGSHSSSCDMEPKEGTEWGWASQGEGVNRGRCWSISDVFKLGIPTHRAPLAYIILQGMLVAFPRGSSPSLHKSTNAASPHAH